MGLMRSSCPQNIVFVKATDVISALSSSASDGYAIFYHCAYGYWLHGLYVKAFSVYPSLTEEPQSDEAIQVFDKARLLRLRLAMTYGVWHYFAEFTLSLPKGSQ